MTFKTIESTHLSDGSLLELTRTGRNYRVMLASPAMFEAPLIKFGLNKAQAYEIYADFIKCDVLEV